MSVSATVPRISKIYFFEVLMSTLYRVKQGDHISSIAAEYGIPRDRIWNDPENADLKARRVNSNVLYPGDQVFLPDLSVAEYPRPTDLLHKFTVNEEPLELRMVLRDQYEKPIANAQCELRASGSATTSVTTDGEGKFTKKIDPAVKSILLTIHGDQTPYADSELPIKIGYLDPVEELTGQQARLKNLGYFAGEVGGSDGGSNRVSGNDAFESAVEEFQCDHALAVDGDCGPNTQAKLKQVHGC
jgi:Putative peptidoglycan binding domain/LysM domain